MSSPHSVSDSHSDSDCRRLIAVFGATGQQGGAVFRALTSTNEFRVRVITRDCNSEAAQNLLLTRKSKAAEAKAEGEVKDEVELFAGDITNPDSLHKALSGVWGVFVMTQFPLSNEDEVVKNVADEALKAGVKFFVFSSLCDAVKLSGGRHEVVHFTAKNKAEQYIRTLPFSEGVTFPYAGVFASNYLSNYLGPTKNSEDGFYEFKNILRNDVALPIVDIEEEFGSTVLEIFRHPKQYNGQSIFTGTYLTSPQLAEAFTKGTGKPARYIQLAADKPKNAIEAIVLDMWQYCNSTGYYGGAAIQHIPNVKKTDAVAFWKKHAKQFP